MGNKRYPPGYGVIIGTLLVLIATPTLCYGLFAWGIKTPVDVIAIGFLALSILLGAVCISLEGYINEI